MKRKHRREEGNDETGGSLVVCAEPPEELADHDKTEEVTGDDSTAEHDPADELLEDPERKTGVIYIQRLPNGMELNHLKHYMSQFGELGRVFLNRDDSSPASIKDPRSTKTSGRSSVRDKFLDGWIEFMDKRIAKRVALSLNTTPVGGPKRLNRFRDDLWNLRYLPGFKWSHLTEHIIFKKHVRREQYKLQMSRARKEQDVYIANVELAKKRKHIADRRRAQTSRKELSEVATEKTSA